MRTVAGGEQYARPAIMLNSLLGVSSYARRKTLPSRVEQGMATKTASAVKKVRELTDEEILKAPEKDYMNEAQLAFFKKKLLELRDQLLQNADDTGEHLRENEITTDPSDRATLEEEYTL